MATPAGIPHAFPLSVDGVDVVASLVLVADRRAGRKSGWLPWAALAIGTAASLAANIATADAAIVSRVIAGWPAVALLIAVKLLSGILEPRTVANDLADTRADDSAKSPSPVEPPVGRPHRAGSSPDRPSSLAGSTGLTRRGTTPADVATLEQAARAVRYELHRDGHPAH